MTPPTDVVDPPDWAGDRDAMIVFALRWAPFGGGVADDIWATFGTTPTVYFHRSNQLLDASPPDDIDDQMWTRLQQVCTQRLTSPPARSLKRALTAPPVVGTGHAVGYRCAFDSGFTHAIFHR